MRYIEPYIRQDLAKKMVFVGGPRQVGKTTLAQYILARTTGRYFNWDYDVDRQAVLNRQWSDDAPLLVFDELHKFPRWKNWLKGIYDVEGDRHSILVTGSARLDIYRRGGDSMLGRYHYWRLHPYTIDELPDGVEKKEGFERLMQLGGFPEPFLENDARTARRWQRERLNRVLQEDIRDLEPVRDIGNLVLLLDLLRTRVGGLLVLSNLAQDLQVAPQSVKAWLSVFERMYLLFTVRPYTRSLPRAVQKPPKVYFFDNQDVSGDAGARFENLVATHLLKRLHFEEDYDGRICQLHYIRDKEGREVDFAIVRDNVLEELIEVKYNDTSVSRHLKYYVDKLRPARATQLVATLDTPFDQDGIRVTGPLDYFANPPWAEALTS
ncbi:MAG: ATP-binding protein [Candidatus Electrothrix sp. Rat3]|nr:ATP-binding protein [Candidatus Electrothrix rattekaaiensis]